MKALRTMIWNIGSTTHPLVILLVILLLNVSWLITLDAAGRQFSQIAGLLPIDLQNTSSVLSAAGALEQIATYSAEAKLFYWVFFVMDNLMPPLVFGVFALLWAYYLSRGGSKWAARLGASPFLLIPLGVGVFDWLENLCFVSVVADPTAAGALQIMEIGLVLTRIKALFLFATFGLTLTLTAYHLIGMARRMVVSAGRRRALSHLTGAD